METAHLTLATFTTLAALILPGSTTAAAAAPRFSLDPASASLVGGISSADVLQAGPALHTPGGDLGLGGLFDNLNGLSYGLDPISRHLAFSVDRVALGTVGTAVFADSRPGIEDAARQIYEAIPHQGSNRRLVSGDSLGLVAGFFGDDVDALELESEPNPFTFFTTEFPHAGGDILVSAGGGTFSIFASGVSLLGLDPGDVIDGLVVLDKGQPGVLDPGLDQVLFSLNVFSPSAFTTSGNSYIPGVLGALSPADVLYTDFTGTPTLWEPAARLGLRPEDELNALDTLPELPVAIPESDRGLWSGLFVAIAAFQRWCWCCRRKSRQTTRAALPL